MDLYWIWQTFFYKFKIIKYWKDKRYLIHIANRQWTPINKKCNSLYFRYCSFCKRKNQSLFRISINIKILIYNLLSKGYVNRRKIYTYWGILNFDLHTKRNFFLQFCANMMNLVYLVALKLNLTSESICRSSNFFCHPF